MPLIKARTERTKAGRFMAPLWVENLETVHAYAAFIGETTTYVVNESIAMLNEKDVDFKAWRKDHPGPFYKPMPRADKVAKKPRPTALRTAV